MNSKALWTSGIAFLFLTVLSTIGAPAANAQAIHVRWDIIQPGTPLVAGGSLSAKADNGSKITLTGTGTFVAPASGQGSSNDVTGGGTWAIDAPSASGTYEVTGLVRFDEEPAGTLVGTGITDTIDDLEDAHAGLAILSISYSDGEHGILVVSCHLPGSPPTVFEGITVSKGFVDFFNPVQALQTTFHVKD